MDLRKAYEMVIRDQLKLLAEHKGIIFEDADMLAYNLADEQNYADDLLEATEQHLNTYGEDYGL